jgi:hypothetical protein
MALAFTYDPLTALAWIQSQTICVVLVVDRWQYERFLPTYCSFLCQCDSINGLYSFTHVALTLCTLSN